jgi:hypothetical protein
VDPTEREAYKSLLAEREALIASAAPRHCRLVAVVAANAVWPDLKAFYVAKRDPRVSELSDLLTTVWTSFLDESLLDQLTLDRAKFVMDLTPDTDDYPDLEGSLASNAGAALAHATIAHLEPQEHARAAIDRFEEALTLRDEPMQSAARRTRAIVADLVENEYLTRHELAALRSRQW